IPSTLSSAATKCISDVPGFVKHTLTPPATSVRARLSAPFILASSKVVRIRSTNRPVHHATIDRRSLARGWERPRPCILGQWFHSTARLRSDSRARKPAMRTVVRGGWIVGFAEGTHTLIPDGVVVYEDDRIAFVGRRFEGPADAEIDARGKLVCPGFI